jgi:aryl-alcohol dehydrogenase-like predicted oxidoreductase
MEYRPLGRTGVHVSKLCLGTMMFGAWGNTNHDDSIRIIHRALDAGINFIDTADVYSAGESEQIVGKALKGHRDDFVLATKVNVPMVAEEAGMSLIELAIAFVTEHPAVTSAIIGPRTMEQLDSQLPAAEVALDPALLDRIDGLVAPGVVLNPADTSYGEQVLKPSLRRR